MGLNHQQTNSTVSIQPTGDGNNSRGWECYAPKGKERASFRGVTPSSGNSSSEGNDTPELENSCCFAGLKAT